MSSRLFLLTFMIVGLLLRAQADAAEPIRVNFGARQDEEARVLREIADAYTVEAVEDALEKLTGRQVSVATYEKLFDIYESGVGTDRATAYGSLGQYFARQASQGKISVPALKSLISRPVMKGLIDVVSMAIENDPSLKPVLRPALKDGFARMVQAESSFAVTPSYIRLVNADDLKKDKATLERFRSFVSVTADSSPVLQSVLVGNPELAPLLSQDFPILSLDELKLTKMLRFMSESRIRNLSTIQEPDKALQAQIDLEVHRSAVEASRNQIMKALDAIPDEKTMSALRLLNGAMSEPYHKAVDRLALSDVSSDVIREAALRALGSELAERPTGRETILKGAVLLKKPSQQMVEYIGGWVARPPGLNVSERELIQKFTGLSGLPTDSQTKDLLVAMRRRTLQNVVSICPDAFKTLGH